MGKRLAQMPTRDVPRSQNGQEHLKSAVSTGTANGTPSPLDNATIPPARLVNRHKTDGCRPGRLL